MDLQGWWRARQSNRRTAQRAKGRDVPVPCSLQRTELGRPPGPWLPGTLELGAHPTWTGGELRLALDPATWQRAGWTDRPELGLHDRTMVLRLASGDVRVDLAVSPTEMATVDAAFD